MCMCECWSHSIASMLSVERMFTVSLIHRSRMWLQRMTLVVVLWYVRPHNHTQSSAVPTHSFTTVFMYSHTPSDTHTHTHSPTLTHSFATVCMYSHTPLTHTHTHNTQSHTRSLIHNSVYSLPHRRHTHTYSPTLTHSFTTVCMHSHTPRR